MINLTAIITPLNIIFLTVLLGYFIGNIKILHISLGLSGILVVAVIFGVIIVNTALGDNKLYINELQLKMKTLSTLGSAMFVSVIGINTGISLKSNVKGNLLALAIGAFMTVGGVLAAFAIGCFSEELSLSTQLGVLCGALTSTPALSAVCENKNIVATEAIIGYSCAYLFGVVLAVLAVNIISSKSTVEEFAREEICNRDKKSGFRSFIIVCIVSLLGNIVGSLEIPVIKFSLGNTGGILCVGTLVGSIVRKTDKIEQLSINMLECIRNIGLSLFFVGTGICAGLEFVYVNWIMVVFGAIITVTSLMIGIILSVILAKKELKAASVLAGGMTSSPALGVLTEKKKQLSMGQFSFSYFGALMTLILIIGFFNCLKVTLT